MPFSIHKLKGERYFRYWYYLDDPKHRVRGSTRRTTKEAARKYAKQLFDEACLERDGLGPSKAEREASKKGLGMHLNDFLDQKDAEGRDAKYVKGLKTRLNTIFLECGWSRIVDIKRDDFEAWRSKQHWKPKTLNDYLGDTVNFTNWLLESGRMVINPLARVSKVSTSGAESRKRRAFTLDELDRLLRVSGKRCHRPLQNAPLAATSKCTT